MAPQRTPPPHEAIAAARAGRRHSLQLCPDRVEAVRRGRAQRHASRTCRLDCSSNGVLLDKVGFKPSRFGPCGHSAPTLTAVIPAPEQEASAVPRLDHRHLDDVGGAGRPADSGWRGHLSTVNDDGQARRIARDRGCLGGLPIEFRNAIDVSRRKAPRWNAHAGRDSLEHRSAIRRKPPTRIVHRGGVIIRSVTGMLSQEAILGRFVEIVIEHHQILFAVFSLVLVPQSHRMPDLMHDGIDITSVRRQRDFLFAANRTHRRSTVPRSNV